MIKTTVCGICGVLHLSLIEKGKRRIGGVRYNGKTYGPHDLCVPCWEKAIDDVLQKRDD